MAQLVFVHGVATRSTPETERAFQNRDALFRSLLFNNTAVDIHAPRWCDLVPPIHADVFKTDASLRSFSLEAGRGTMGGGIGGGGVAGDNTPVLMTLASQNPNATLDALFIALAERADADERLLGADELDAYAQAVQAIDDGRAAELFQALRSDMDLARRLSKVESFGIGSTVRDAIGAVAGRIRNAVSTVGFDAVRDALSPAIALFLGDVFCYLKQGPLRDAIQQRIRAALVQAHANSKASGTPLIVIGHSLGGVILTDMLQAPAACDLPDDLRIDALLTVGSQPGLFQSLGVLSAPAAGLGKAPRPACVTHWFNVFDPIDPLAFRADASFDDVSDMVFDSLTGLASSHTTYFKRPQFHSRCRVRLRGLGIL
jgi:hypothetical protein